VFLKYLGSSKIEIVQKFVRKVSRNVHKEAYSISNPLTFFYFKLFTKKLFFTNSPDLGTETYRIIILMKL